MRPVLHAAALVALLAICFAICVTGYQIADRDAHFQDDLHQGNTLLRAKRQMETFEDGEFSSPQQEDSGFWDRVVKVALKLFSKFVEWLNA